MNIAAFFILAVGLLVTTLAIPLSGPYSISGSSISPSAPEPYFDPSFNPALPPVHFCGESVPLHEEIIARRLLSALASKTVASQALYQIRQRAAKFFPVIEPILAFHHVPSDFKYLPLVESALQGFAVSPKGAVGYWQFMPATARELGLRIHPSDERQNLIKSTHAACRYLNYLHDRLGSWTLAAAAYNNGIGALLSNIRRQQQHDYYYLRLNAETGKYLYRILAFKELFSNYCHYESLIPTPMMALLSEPLIPESAPKSDEALLSQAMVDDETHSAIDAPMQESAPLATGQTTDIPLPNAADVFRGGIKARLTEAATVKRGEVWSFRLTRSNIIDKKQVEEGDILYAIVEDIDQRNNKVYLRADKIYSTSDRQTYYLSLAAVDASTGRIGVSLNDIDRVKAGWILTWKQL